MMLEKFTGLFKKPIVIDTPYGPVSESARRQAAYNLKIDPQKRRQVEEMLGKELGSPEAGRAEAKRRYPEAYA
jgi:hypothetical protein